MSENIIETNETVEQVAPIEVSEETRMLDEKHAKKKKLLAIWDKVTTGLLILFMASPLLIVGYILLWFLSK